MDAFFGKEICEPILLGDPGAFPNTFGLLGTGWLPLALIAFAVSLLILALFYIFSSFLRNQQMTAWTKHELSQAIVTAILIGLTYFIITGMCGFDMGFLTADYSGKNVFVIVGEYLHSLELRGTGLFGVIMWVANLITSYQKIVFSSIPLGFGFEDSPMEGLSQLNSILFVVFSAFVTSFLLLGFQMNIMYYMTQATFLYLYPFGIFFRAFEPTRTFGGVLIGIAITFFLFYPALIVLNDFILHKHIDALGSEVDAVLGAADQDAASSSASTQADSSDIDAAAVVGDQDKTEEMVGGIASKVFFISKWAGFYAIAAVFFPIINFIILVEIARAITKAVGEEVDVSNLTRLI